MEFDKDNLFPDLYYMLDKDGNPIPGDPDNPKEMGLLMKDIKKRTVKRSHVKCGRILISTVFVVMSVDGYLWETMIFGGKYSGWGIRYNSRKEAIMGHNVAVRLSQGHKPSRISDKIAEFCKEWEIMNESS